MLFAGSVCYGQEQAHIAQLLLYLPGGSGPSNGGLYAQYRAYLFYIEGF